MRRTVLCALAVIAGCGGAAPAPAVGPAVFVEPAWPAPVFPPDRKAKLLAALPEVERGLAEWFAQSGAPGLAAGLIVDDELVWSRGFGVRDLASRAPVDADTVFRIASMSKAFTAVAILRLRDAGVLALDDPAARWVPELRGLRYPSRDARALTIRDLLAHGGGLPEDNASGDHTLDWTRDQLRGRLRAPALSTTPGTEFEYSNLGYEILGLIVERAGGLPYPDYVTRHVLEPLGMRSAVWDPRQVPADHAAVGYGRRLHEPLAPEAQLPVGAGAPMGGLYASVRDLARFVGWQLSAWPARDQPDRGPLARASVREMQLPTRGIGLGVARWATPPIIAAEGYGFGLGSSYDCKLGWVVIHSGGLPGFGSVMIWLPERGVGVVLMTNLTYNGGTPAAYAVLRQLADGGLLPERVRPASAALTRAQAVVTGLLAGADDAALLAAFDSELAAHETVARLGRGFAGVRARHGVCRPTGEITASNALRGSWKLTCERGELDAAAELTVDERLQAVHFTEKEAPGEPLLAAARLLVELLGGAAPAGLDAIAGELLDRGRAEAHLARWRADGCVLGEATESDGVEHAIFTVTCGAVRRNLRVVLDPAGRLERFAFWQPPPALCPDP